MRVLCGKEDVACALRETRECVEQLLSVLDRLEWERYDRVDDVGDVGCGRENCWEIGSSRETPESTRLCLGLVVSGGSVGGVSEMRSSGVSIDRRTSFRGV